MDQQWQMTVSTGGDTLRAERLLRDLRANLHGVEGVSIESPRAEVIPGEHKGVGLTDPALWATVASSPVLITAIKAWCGHDRHRKIELTRRADGVSIVVSGAPTPAQERIVQEFLSKRSTEQ